METTHDVAVVGAGPGGTIAALQCARLGLKTVLIEERVFPAGKACGECVSALGADILSKLGLWKMFASLCPIELRTAAFYSGCSKWKWDMPEPMWGISREKLDLFLLEEARASGAEIVQPAELWRFDRTSMEMSVRKQGAAKSIGIRARAVVGAGGRATSWWGTFSHKPAKKMGVKVHITGIEGPQNGVELFSLPGGYVGLSQVEAGVWNIATSLYAWQMANYGKDYRRLFDDMCVTNGAFGERMRGSVFKDEWLAAALPIRKPDRRWTLPIVPVGNTLAAVEPVGGEGMGLAMASGYKAACAIKRHLSRPRPWDEESLKHAFDSLWRWRSFYSWTLGAVLSRPFLAHTVLSACSLMPHGARRVGAYCKAH